MKLAPVAPPPIPTAADKLPDIAGKLKLQKGFNIEVYASGVANARSMRQGDKGTIFVGSRLQDKVHAIVEKGGKRTHCATGLQTLMSIVGRAGVKD